MRLFGISKEDDFVEYVKAGFSDEHYEAMLESWLENNPDGILDDSKLLIIGRQIRTTHGGILDLLAVDRWGDVIVLELKRGRTPRDTIAQSLEYAAYAARLNYAQIETLARKYQDDETLSLVDVHRDYFALAAEEGISFNKNQRIVIVGETVTVEIQDTAEFLNQRGLHVTCLEFSFFQTEDRKRLLSVDTVVADRIPHDRLVVGGSRGKTTREQFMKSLDANGDPVFAEVLSLAEQRGLPIHWGSRGFSVNVNPDGKHFKFCYGYPPSSVYGQSIYTRLFDSAFLTRVNGGETLARELAERAKATGLFVSAGSELKCSISRAFSAEERGALLGWLRCAADRIEQAGLRSDSDDQAQEA